VYKEIELNSMVNRIVSLWLELQDSRESIRESLTGLLRLYIKGAKPDEIIRYIYTDIVLERLKRKRFDKSIKPFKIHGVPA
ncbi:unnamed protein product, partial [marine sediment metagenome]